VANEVKNTFPLVFFMACSAVLITSSSPGVLPSISELVESANRRSIPCSFASLLNFFKSVCFAIVPMELIL